MLSSGATSAPTADAALADLLRQAIVEAQGGDVLAPVDVVVPGGLAGVTLRRASAGPRGWANVRFSSLPQLAERICVTAMAQPDGRPQRRPLTGEDRRRAVRRVLALVEGRTPLLDAARRQRGTAALLESVFAELDGAAVDPVGRPPGLSPRGREVLELYAGYREQVSEMLTSRQLLRLAARVVRSGGAPAGTVVYVRVHEPAGPEQELLAALDDTGRLRVVRPPRRVPAATRLLVAPDAEEEVRLAVREALTHLARSGCRPERIGMAYVSATPYVRLLAEQLTAAGLPHHVPSRRTLAETVTGRTVLGLLALHERGLPRVEVLRWMGDGPLLGADGRRLRPSSWERLSRDAGVHRGLDTWRTRLHRYADDQLRRADEPVDDGRDGSARREAFTSRAERARVLLAEVEQLHATADAVLTAGTWPAASERLVTLLHRCLGRRRDVDRWASVDGVTVETGLEQKAYDAVEALLSSLADLDGPVDARCVREAVAEAMTGPVPSGTTLGRGVLVGAVRSFAGADLDLLLVLGATEDALPSRQGESALLRDADRALLSADLPTVGSRRTDEREHWTAALASARTCLLSYPRADTRSQRRQWPSPWYLEQSRRLPGGPVTAGAVDEGDLDVDWFTSYPSFDAALRSATTFGSAHEVDVATSLHGGVDEVAKHDDRLARGLQAARSRTSGAFDAWSGRTGTLPPTLRAAVDDHLSATTLQSWAACPASHLYGSVLGVRELEDRGGDDTVDARDKGTLVHGVLEELVRGRLGTVTEPGLSPDEAWTRDDLATAVGLLERDAEQLTARGLTGREVLWEAQLARLRRALVRVLANDSALRAQRRAWPVAVEAPFGRKGVPPLVVELPTQGPVSFAGYVDRIDATETGGLVVVDYKTGRGSGYEGIPKSTSPRPDADLSDRGRRLQLLLYGLAARRLQGLPDADVQAWFWFVELGDLHRGGPVTPEQERRLLTVLDVTVSGIRGGTYPANPGKESWRAGRTSWENCRYCAFDRVCATTRSEQWDAHRTDPAVRPYSEFADPQEPDA